MSTTGPGQTKTAVQPLEEGTHYVLDTESEDPSKGAQAKFDVKGGGGVAEPPDAPATITASEYQFETAGLKAGSNRVLRERRSGAPPHNHGAAQAGKDDRRLRAFARTEKGEPPVEEEKFVGTAVLGGGASQVVDLDLQQGKYVGLCFITDRKGGPPHVAKGMVMEVKVQ